MFKILFSAILALSVAPSIADAQDIFDVYIMAGQSNMDGRGEVRDLSAAQLANIQNDAIISYLSPGSERERAVPTSNPNDLDAGSSGFTYLIPGGFSVDATSSRVLSDTFGPELSFGASIAEATGSNNQIAIIKVSRGGTNLRNDWRVNSTVNSGPDEPEGFLYRALIEEVNNRLADLRADGSTVNVKGFIWHQGESDSSNGAYVEQFIEFVENVRDEFDENIPFVVGELSRDRTNSVTFNTNIAQLVADSADPNNLDVPSNIFLVSSLGLETPMSLNPNNLAADATHFTANGQLELGQRYASSISSAFDQRVNLSQGRPASQSSTGFGGSANRAVDGNTNGIYGASSTTHTNVEVQPWWQVDLGSISSITHINLYNRTDDCCRSRLSDFYVLISDTPFTSDSLSSNLLNPNVDSFYHGPSAGDPTRIDVNTNGRYVRVQLAGTNPLSLAEVEVFGTSDTDNNNLTNLSQGRSANQSSTGFGGSANRAVDGNTNGIYGASSTTHTNVEVQPWWQVDLGSISSITHINLYNRTDDCCRSRLSEFYVLISDTPFTSDSLSSNLSNPNVDSFYHGPSAGDPTSIDVNTNGRYVRVQLAGTNPLSLAEVEVFGTN